MSDFKLPPVSTLIGSTIANYFRILKQGHVSSRYRYKIFLTTITIIVTTPFHWWEKLYFHFKLKKTKFNKPTLFILGHWRSGTTLLHNMLCTDPDSSYLTTYQSVFPNNLASKSIFKTYMAANIPEKRPSDNMKLGIDMPQEDEFAFSNSYHHSYYNFFYFPLNYDAFYKRALHFEGLKEWEKKKWYRSYDTLLKKAYINTKGNRLIIKNPVNTARIKMLLKLYPDAKFLYIYRNPISVFLSTQRFFRNLLPTLNLEDVSDVFIDNMIFDVYKRLMEDYLEQKSLIPENNLIELRYEDFEKDPVYKLKNIYDNLLNEDFESVKGLLSTYFDTLKGYKKNKYNIDAEIINRIKKEFGKYMELYNYDIPPDIVIKN